MIKNEFINRMNDGYFDESFINLYGEKSLLKQKKRYAGLFDEFEKKYPGHNEIFVYSASGRSEIGGNHTDHQHGCVLGTAVNLDIAAAAAFHSDGVIRLKSGSYPENIIELDDLTVHENEKGKSSALVRGIVSRFSEMGVKIGGFDVVMTSDVLVGSGLSSSAAFEVLIGTIIDKHYNGGRTGAVEIAKIGQYAENVYFGKSSGLMDQMVSSVGGFVFIDFKNAGAPEIKSCSFDFENAGYSLCIVDTKGSHADLTDDYVSVPEEMKSVAAVFGKKLLREVDENEFYKAVPRLRETCSHRAVLRAAHFFDENRRAVQEAQAIENGDMPCFLELVRKSGESSANLLQNLYSCRRPEEQGIPLALMMSGRILGEKGAARVHGGGFAGTIQAFVPSEKLTDYAEEMNRIFGEGSCHILRIRSVGGTEIL